MVRSSQHNRRRNSRRSPRRNSRRSPRRILKGSRKLHRGRFRSVKADETNTDLRRLVPNEVKVQFYTALENREVDVGEARRRWHDDHILLKSLGHEENAKKNEIGAGKVIKIGDNNIVTLAFLIKPERVRRCENVNVTIGLVQTHDEENNNKPVCITKDVNSKQLFEKTPEPNVPL